VPMAGAPSSQPSTPIPPASAPRDDPGVHGSEFRAWLGAVDLQPNVGAVECHPVS
jgi:hypothetical protein